MVETLQIGTTRLTLTDKFKHTVTYSHTHTYTNNLSSEKLLELQDDEPLSNHPSIICLTSRKPSTESHQVSLLATGYWHLCQRYLVDSNKSVY